MEKIPLHFIKTDSMTITLNVDLEIGTKDISNRVLLSGHQ